MELSPIAKRVKEIFDGSYIAQKRGRRFRIKEHELLDILIAVTELETGVKHVAPAVVQEQKVEKPKVLKKGEEGYEEWLASLPPSKVSPPKK
jgi:hypothetical protein